MKNTRLTDGILAALTLIAIVPFWAGDLYLSVDLPQHLATAQIALDYADPTRGFERFYTRDLAPRPYVGTTYLFMLLGQLMPLTLAARVALSLYAASLVFAARALIRSQPNTDPRLAWWAPLFVHSWPLVYGFLGFVFALPAVLFGLAVLTRASSEPRKHDDTKLLAAHTTALLFHPVAWGVLVAASAPALFRRRAERRCLVAVALPALVLLPMVLFASTEGTRLSDAGIHTAWRWGIKHKLASFSLACWDGRWDEALVLPPLVGLAVFVLLNQARRIRAKHSSSTLERGALVLFGLYLVLPGHWAELGLKISLLSPRMAVLLWLVSLALVGRPKAAWSGAALLFVPAFSGLILFHNLEFQRWAAEVRSAAVEIPAGAKVLPHVETRGSAVDSKLLAHPAQSLHGYAIVLGRAGYDPALFSTRQSPVRIREAAPAPRDAGAFDVRWSQSDGSIRLQPPE